MDLLEYPAGAIIFKAGDPATQAFLICDGMVDLLGGSNGAAIHLARLEVGEVFGEMSLVEERPRSLTAQAVGPVQLSGLTRAEFEHLLIADPTMFRVYLKTLFERLRTLPVQVEAARAEPVSVAGDIKVTIHPLTRRTATILPDAGVHVTRYPFRIGRAAADRERIPADTNDLWLDDEMPFNISRNHALLEREASQVIVKDRGSSLGIFVNDVQIGGKSRERQMALEDGDNVVVLGTRMSPFQFRVDVIRG